MQQLKYLTFEKLAQTKYSNPEPGVLAIDVTASASAIIVPFSKIQHVKKVSFEWYSVGKIDFPKGINEKSKKGDDALLRIGLIISGEKPRFSFLAPAWLKTLATHIKFSSDRMLYLTVQDPNRFHSEKWVSPYHDSITAAAVLCRKTAILNSKWQACSFELSTITETVALWIMADGDNTGASFKSFLRNLILE
ncbi:MAG: DUF3047 domain-containing protein [Oligoflexales bacterium]|nr:DUF3047 domain-containing protein [Oligoflexales bacterium]